MADLGGPDVTMYRERQLLDTEFIRNPSILQLDEDDEYDSDSDGDNFQGRCGHAPDLIDDENNFFFLDNMPGRGDEDSTISGRSSSIYRPDSCVFANLWVGRHDKNATSPDEGQSAPHEAPVISGP
ncbi:hypothetical protein KJ359_003870 [Pestalotiopsis sp. 9143b]|nr:hypothetical protein KJ359_003870 [Pestalotiopsis sp. 9143b]